MALEELLEQKSLEINSLQQAYSKLLQFCSAVLQVTHDQLTQLIVIKPQIEELRENLFDIVLKSKNSKELGLDAAKAISILNKSKFSFSGKDLSGVNISGADLSCGIFDGTIFENANLDNVNFNGSWLNNSNFQGASIENIGSVFEEEIEDSGSDVDFITISPNGKFVVLILEQKRKIIVFDTNDGMLSFKQEININAINDTLCDIDKIIFSNDSQKIIINYSGNSRFISMLDLYTGSNTKFFITNTKCINNLMFSSDDKKIIFFNENYTIISLDIKNTKQKVFLNDESLKKDIYYSINCSPNNKDLILVSRNTINILDTQTKKLTTLYSEGSFFNRYNENVMVIFSCCGELVAATINEVYSNHKIKLWHMADPQGSVKTFDTLNVRDGECGFVIGLSFSPDSKYLVAIQDCSGNHFLYVWNCSTQQRLIRLELTLRANNVIWNQNNNLIVASNNNVLIWKINVNELNDSINLQLLFALNQNKLSLHGSNFSQTKKLVADEISSLKLFGAFIEEDNLRPMLLYSSSNSSCIIPSEENPNIQDLRVENGNSPSLLNI